jgi:hypothetical protein
VCSPKIHYAKQVIIMTKTSKAVKHVKQVKQAKPRAYVAPIFLKQDALHAEREMERQSSLCAAFKKAGAATFVSTSMCVAQKGEDHADSEIIYIGSIAHYRLTPLFWAWLRHAFGNATRACETGKLGASTYSELLNRISRIYNLAIAQFGEADLKSAEQTFTPAKWKRHCESLERGAKTRETYLNGNIVSNSGHAPTGAYRYPADGTGAYHPVSKTALALVDAIRDKALALGWTMDQLYRNIGMAHRDWGLVCYIGSEDRIGEITLQSIEIINRSGSPSSFFMGRSARLCA